MKILAKMTIAEIAHDLDINRKDVELLLKEAGVKPLGYTGQTVFYRSNIMETMRTLLYKKYPDNPVMKVSTIDLLPQETIQEENNKILAETLLLEEELFEPSYISSNPFIKTKEASDFINAFLYAGGVIEDASLRFSSNLESRVLWLKECFALFKITGIIKKKTNGKTKKIVAWNYESYPYAELALFEKEWFYNRRGTTHRGQPEFENTPLVLFFWFLFRGRFYESKQYKYNGFLSSSGLQVDRSERVAVILDKIGVNYFIKGTSGFCIKEPEYEKFFTYICEIPYLIPDRFRDKFPPNFIRYNKTWVEKL